MATGDRLRRLKVFLDKLYQAGVYRFAMGILELYSAIVAHVTIRTKTIEFLGTYVDWTSAIGIVKSIYVGG